MTTENLVKSPERRKKRTTLGTRNILKVEGKDPQFTYRIVNIEGNRIQEFLEMDWEIDTDEDVRVGDSSLKKATGLGTVREISVGQGKKAILMKKRKDWHEEDQHEKQVHVNRTEEATRQKALDGTYGKLEITRS